MPPLCIRASGTGAAEVLITERELVIGRGADAAVRIDSPFVSRDHARVFQKGGRAFVMPVGLNPTFLNGRSLPPDVTAIGAGDVLSVHGFEIVVEFAGAKFRSNDDDIQFAEKQAAAHKAIVTALDVRDFRTLDVTSKEGRRTVATAITSQVSGLDFADFASLASFGVRQATRDSVLLSLFAAEPDPEMAMPFGNPGTYARGEKGRERLVADVADRLELKGKSLRHVLVEMSNRYDEYIDGRQKSLDPADIRHMVFWFLRKNLMDLMLGLGPLEDLLKLPGVSEVMVVSRERIFLETDGLLVLSGRRFANLLDLQTTIGRIVGPKNVRVDVSEPMADTSLADGSRVNIVVPPVSVGDPAITIRRFSKTAITVEDLVTKGSLSRAAAVFLSACVKSHLNIVVSGGTGTGKTTLLNAFSGWISPGDRIVTIEDTAELRIPQPHVVALLARAANAEGKGRITIADLVRNALRMRPDRIIVGECRGPEALAMIKAMNTGHDGSMTTGHANSPEEMLQRLEGMILEAVDMPIGAVRQLVAGGVHLIVQLARLSSGARVVSSIAEVQDFDSTSNSVILQRLFEHDPQRGLIFTGALPECIEKLIRLGGLSPEQLFERVA